MLKLEQNKKQILKFSELFKKWHKLPQYLRKINTEDIDVASTEHHEMHDVPVLVIFQRVASPAFDQVRYGPPCSARWRQEERGTQVAVHRVDVGTLER